MRKLFWQYSTLVIALGLCLKAGAQEPWTWEKVRQQFESNNPTLRAGSLNVDEARANEITANLRPNPQLGVVLDQFPVFNPSLLSPNNAQWTPTVTQLIERQGKRHLRYQSAQLATRLAQSDNEDLQRNLLFNLRDAFIRLLAADSILQLANDNLTYYDKVIGVNRERYKAGDIAKIDLQRVELQRAQFESDYQNAQINQRQSKLDLLALMNVKTTNDRTSVDQFNVAGNFDFLDVVPDLAEVRQAALDTRRAELDAIEAELVPWSGREPLAGTVARLGCYRGIAELHSLALAAEVVDWHRFPSARAFMGFTGLVPGEYSSGDKTRRGPVTKAGSEPVRTALVEAAWAYRFKPAIGVTLRRRQRDAEPGTLARSWKAQRHLHAKYKAMTARGKPQAVAVTGVARELAGFVWAEMTS